MLSCPSASPGNAWALSLYLIYRCLASDTSAGNLLQLPEQQMPCALAWVKTFGDVPNGPARCRQVGSPLPRPGPNSVKHMGRRLGQPVRLNGCDVQHLIEAAGALLHLPEQQILRPRPGQHGGGMHPQLWWRACAMMSACQQQSRPHIQAEAPAADPTIALQVTISTASAFASHAIDIAWCEQIY